MELPTLKVSPRLRDLLAYDKLAGPVPRMLVLESRYWLDIACEHAAQQLGWEYETVPVAMEGVMARESYAALFEKLIRFRPDFVLTVNLSGMDVDGMLARFFDSLRMPYVAWFVDNPRTILMDRDVYATQHAVALTWEEAYSHYLTQRGFPTVRHLPLAVDPVVFNQPPIDATSFPPTFVGNSNAALADPQWRWVANKPELEAAVCAAFAEGRVTRERFAAGLDAMLDHSLAAQLDAEQRRNVEYLLFTEGTRRLRLDFAKSLAPEGVQVRGDEGWAGAGIDPGPPVTYMTELPRFYRECEVNLNITSIQMPTTVNQRVFDCPAAGGFVLTDAQPALEALLEPGTEIAVFRDIEECRDRLRYYRYRPQERRVLVDRARARIFAHHTYAHRLQTIAGIVRERFCS